jgi:alpha-ribazole phosphatase
VSVGSTERKRLSRLVLVRHAEPAEDARGLCYGRLDVGLSDRGRVQAAELAAALAGVEIDAVYSSPRTRAVETAAALGVDVRVDERLREIDFGELEGRSYEDIERTDPALFRAWMDAPTTVQFPGGECYDDLRMRATEALEEIRRRHDVAAVVAHGGVVRSVLQSWLELPAHAIFRLDQSYCGVSIVDWIDDVPIVRLLNGALPLQSLTALSRRL